MTVRAEDLMRDPCPGTVIYCSRDVQCAALFAIFVALESWKWSDAAVQRFTTIRDGLVWAMLGATALSGLQYVWRAAVIMKNEMEL